MHEPGTWDYVARKGLTDSKCNQSDGRMNLLTSWGPPIQNAHHFENDVFEYI